MDDADRKKLGPLNDVMSEGDQVKRLGQLITLNGDAGGVDWSSAGTLLMDLGQKIVTTTAAVMDSM